MFEKNAVGNEISKITVYALPSNFVERFFVRASSTDWMNLGALLMFARLSDSDIAVPNADEMFDVILGRNVEWSFRVRESAVPRVCDITLQHAESRKSWRFDAATGTFSRLVV